MADEIQLHIQGNTRAAVEADLVEGELGFNQESTVLEGVYRRKIDGTFLHFPSEQKLDDIDKANKSGAQFIGVDGNDFNILTGDTDLQAVLENIDSTLVGLGASPSGVILANGTVPLTGDWDTGGSNNITSLLGLFLDDGSFDSIRHVDDLKGIVDFSGEDSTIGFGSTTSGIPTLRNGFFSTADYWTFGGGWSHDTDKALFTDSGGSGDLEQAKADLDAPVMGGCWYKFTYTVNNNTSGSTFKIPSSITDSFTDFNLPVTNGTHSVYVRLNGLNFKIEAVASGSGSIEFDSLSLQALVGGSVVVNNPVLVGDVRIDGRGISGGGGINSFGENPYLTLIKEDNSDLSASNILLSVIRLGANDFVTGGAGNRSNAYEFEVRTSTAGWSSGDAGILFREKSNLDGTTGNSTFREVDEFQNYRKWPGVTASSVTSSKGEEKLYPVISQIVNTVGPTTVLTIPIEDNSHYMVELKGSGHEHNGSTEDFSVKRIADVIRSGGGAVLNSNTSVHNYTGGTATLNFAVSGNDLLVQATGHASKTVDYITMIKLTNLSNR